MGSRPSNVSLHGAARIQRTDTVRDATFYSVPDKDPSGTRELASLYTALEHDAITALAHHYWQARGCPEGSAEEDWFRAEQAFHYRSEFGSFPDYFDEGAVLRLPH
jgi:hypothetical protein